MTWGNYLKDKTYPMIACVLSFAVVFFIFMVLRIQKEAFIIFGVLYLFPFVFLLIHEGKRQIKFFNELQSSLDTLDKKYFVTDVVTYPEFSVGTFMMDTLRVVNKSMIDEVNIYKNAQAEYKEYIELWIHEVKTPLSVCAMVAQKNKDDTMIEELKKIQLFLEQALFYARSQFAGQDYIVRDIDLKEVVENVVKNNRREFILKKIGIEIALDDAVVKCDSKWLEFIIQQIIGNSLKYTKEKEGVIQVYSQRQKHSLALCIEDNGIGVAAEDLPRVFDKGYTGSLGRISKQATGIGLYLCKVLCEKLGLGISLESEKGTVVKIVFPLENRE